MGLRSDCKKVVENEFFSCDPAEDAFLPLQLHWIPASAIWISVQHLLLAQPMQKCFTFLIS